MQGWAHDLSTHWLYSKVRSVLGFSVMILEGKKQRPPSGSAVKTLSTVQKMQDTWVQSQGQEDSLEKGKSILAWRIPMQRVGHDWSDWACTQRELFQLLTHFTLKAEVEGMPTPPDEVGETDTPGCHHCGASHSSSLSLPPLIKDSFHLWTPMSQWK